MCFPSQYDRTKVSLQIYNYEILNRTKIRNLKRGRRGITNSQKLLNNEQ
ncbi:unnamed protein product [Paramecium sonneborni]|uniref:Uncharacterized protein n=1 Tax=Paramecium sonneborni TaxID=65129 RepID=A0A8S1QNF7_9CILI|nr:unnamed protein product [Paramecium sonneborni]